MIDLRIMNTAGECKRLAQVEELAASAVTDIRVGAITADLGEWHGNAGKNPNGSFFWVDEETGNALNALGLPNPGTDYYREHLPEMVALAHGTGKRLGVNISGRGERSDENATLTELCVACGVDTIEVNVGCPNVWSDSGARKPIASYDPDAVAAILTSVRDALPLSANVEVDVKLSPLVKLGEPLEYAPDMTLPALDEGLVSEIAAVIAEAGFVHAAVSTNTVPNVFAKDASGKHVLDTPNGTGGLSGPIIKDLSLRQNRLLRERLAPHGIECIGAGGITCGADIAEYITAGVSGIQIGTAWMTGGPRRHRIFGDCMQQYFEG